MSRRDDEARDQAARDRAARDEAAWREIVDHYGEPPVVPDTAEPPDPSEAPPPDPFRLELYDEKFVPPPFPPPPTTTPERRLAWLGLVCAPVLLIVLSLAHYSLPGVITALLVAAFLGSFGYLVATMSNEPRDPDDDGARL